MMNSLADELFNILIEDISAAREADRATVENWINGGPWTAKEALKQQIIDGIVYPDELEDELASLYGDTFPVEPVQEVGDYDSAWVAQAKIAMIYITGAIVSGETPGGGLFDFGPTATGSRTIVRALSQAAEDPRVKGILIRVDSPGGSSYASDEIARKIDQLQKNDVPIVISMGGVAASGGYYVSAGADAIWAEPSTITGSIGVYSGKFSTAPLFDMLGINTTTITRGAGSTIYSSNKGWTAQQRARMEVLVGDIYDQFKTRVSVGRELDLAEVEAIAQGRVWSGRQAKEIGLVDNLGGLEEALADTKRRANLSGKQPVSIEIFHGQGFGLGSLTGIQIPAMRSIALSREIAMTTLWMRYPNEQIWMMSPWALNLDAP
jgi:protease-4